MKQIVTATVLNEHGVLSRICGLFAGRGYNIETLTVAPLLDNKLSRITITTSGDKRILEQITKQLHKLIPVLSVDEEIVQIEQETLLAKFQVSENISEIQIIFSAFHGRILETNDKYVIFVACDSSSRIDSLLNSIVRYKPKDITRSGACAIKTH